MNRLLFGIRSNLCHSVSSVLYKVSKMSPVIWFIIIVGSAIGYYIYQKVCFELLPFLHRYFLVLQQRYEWDKPAWNHHQSFSQHSTWKWDDHWAGRRNLMRQRSYTAYDDHCCYRGEVSWKGRREVSWTDAKTHFRLVDCASASHEKPQAQVN